MSRQNEYEGDKFLCIQCDHKATRKSSLQAHIKSVHEGLKFPCEQCDYKSSSSGTLWTHIKSKHEGVKFPSNPKS